MSRTGWILLFFVLITLIALGSEFLHRPQRQCVVDGTGITPATLVVLTEEDGQETEFCSLCCARAWLQEHPEAAASLQDGSSFLTVTDEISGELLDASLAYWVESNSFSRRENRCRLHAFAGDSDAARHISRHGGREAAGYFAGLGRTLPWAEDFVAPDLDGNPVQLADLRGQVVFLRFWNSTNPFYAADLKDLERARQRFQDRGFTVLAMNVDQQPVIVSEAVQGLGLNFHVLLDPGGEISDRYGISGYPTGFLIDRSGIIAGRSVGEVTPDVLAPLLQPLW